ncbi:MAG: VOC family protein [Truepera sp.]|nr:VOC family protein [Truepera sp.]HRQ09455.1 VOC family protein [Trueperaceae bacterium]
MDARVNFITLAVADLGASRAFYVDGLGWEPAFEASGEVLFIRLSPTLVLSLWRAEEFEDEVGAIREGPGASPFTLAHNVGSPAAVDAALAMAVEAGGAILKPAMQRDWGGYSGYFTDPDGFVWEVAYNPGPIGVSLLQATDPYEPR